MVFDRNLLHVETVEATVDDVQYQYLGIAESRAKEAEVVVSGKALLRYTVAR